MSKAGMINANSVLLAPEMRVAGGKKIKRYRDDAATEQHGNRVKTAGSWEAIVFDVEERKEGEAIVATGIGIVRQIATSTPFGWIMDRGSLARLDEKVDALKRRAAEFNLRARTCRVIVDVIPVGIDVADPRVAARLTQHVVTELQAARDALASGGRSIAGDEVTPKQAVTAVQTLIRTRIASLHEVVMGGPAAQHVVWAQEAIVGAFRKLREAVNRDETPESAGRSLEAAGDLNAIDAALDVVSPADVAAVDMNAALAAQ
jgi:hypothetical protein